MTPLEIGLISVAAIVFLIYLGVYIPVALGAVSFVSIWLMRDNFDLAMALLKIAIGGSAMEYSFATIPFFTFMGLIVSKAGLGQDVYEVMSTGFRRVKGGIGMATQGNPIEGATLDIWQTAPNGMYSSQDPEQDTYSFHGIQTTGPDGRYGFTTVKPVSYTVPTDAPVGELLNATGRHPWRPSHLHFIAKAPGFRTLVSEVFPDDDPYLDEDTVFGVREDLVMHYDEQPAGTFPAEGFDLSGKVDGPWLKVTFDLILVKE